MAKPSQVDRHLTGGRPRQGFTEAEAFLEALRIHPLADLHDLVAQHRDVGLGASETQHPDAQEQSGELRPGHVLFLRHS